MSLVDFLFPQQAAASHLRSIRDQNAEAGEVQRLKALRQEATIDDLRTRIDSLEDDLGYLTLVIASLLNTLHEQGTTKREDIKKKLSELDSLDGVADGRLNIHLLKYLVVQATK